MQVAVKSRVRGALTGAGSRPTAGASCILITTFQQGLSRREPEFHWYRFACAGGCFGDASCLVQVSDGGPIHVGKRSGAVPVPALRVARTDGPPGRLSGQVRGRRLPRIRGKRWLSTHRYKSSHIDVCRCEQIRHPKRHRLQELSWTVWLNHEGSPPQATNCTFVHAKCLAGVIPIFQLAACNDRLSPTRRLRSGHGR